MSLASARSADASGVASILGGSDGSLVSSTFRAFRAVVKALSLSLASAFCGTRRGRAREYAVRCDVVGSVVWEAGWERNERERESKLIDHERCSFFLGFARDGVTCTYLILSMELLQRHRDGHLGW